MQGVLAVFPQLDAVCAAIKDLKAKKVPEGHGLFADHPA